MTRARGRGRWSRTGRKVAADAMSLLVLMSVLVVVEAAPAHAAGGIALVQKSPEASSGGTSVTATLPSPTTSGDLLVATTLDLNSGCASDSYTGPSGWIAAVSVCRGGTGPLMLWYRANVPAGITSTTFATGSAGANSIVQISEWSGVATVSPLDSIGSVYSSSSATTLSVSTSTAVAASGELAVTGFDTSAGLSSLTPGTGWTAVRSDPGNGHASDYRISPPSGSTLTESITSNPGTNWAAVIATFKPACSGGSTTLKAAPTIAFPSATLNGYNRTVTQTATVTVDDESGTGSGWNVSATSTSFSAGGGHTLPSTATRITAASGVADAGNCTTATNSTTYPLTLPAGSTPPTAARIYNAAANTGQGPSDVTVTAVITLPANASAGTYTSTWTLTINSGP